MQLLIKTKDVKEHKCLRGLADLSLQKNHTPESLWDGLRQDTGEESLADSRTGQFTS